MYIHKKTWSQSCRSFHVLRPSHCPECRNEQRWKPHVDVYIIPPPSQRAFARSQRGLYIIHLVGRPHCFVLDNLIGTCEIHESSKPKRQLRLYLCICIPTLAQSWAFSKDYGAKIVIISEYCIKKERNFLKMLWVDVWLAVKLWLLPLCLYKNKKLFQQLQLPLLKTILRCFCKMAWHLYCSNRTNIQRARHQYISLYCS